MAYLSKIRKRSASNLVNTIYGIRTFIRRKYAVYKNQVRICGSTLWIFIGPHDFVGCLYEFAAHGFNAPSIFCEHIFADDPYGGIRNALLKKHRKRLPERICAYGANLASTDFLKSVIRSFLKREHLFIAILSVFGRACDKSRPIRDHTQSLKCNNGGSGRTYIRRKTSERSQSFLSRSMTLRAASRLMSSLMAA